MADRHSTRPENPVSRTILALAIGLVFAAQAARADTQATYRCDNGKRFTITFLSANDYRNARLLFAGSTRPVTMENQASGSGSTYAGGGWLFHEHHGDAGLTELAAKPSKDIPCHAVGGP